MSKKKLVIIGANDFQDQLIVKANSLGFETHAFAWAEGAVGKEHADYFYPVSIVDKEEILEKCREIKPDGICSIASDLACITVNFVAENLGLPCNKICYTDIQTNKYLMRQALSQAGIDCPKFVRTDSKFTSEKIKDFDFPVIVKPTDRSGSRCITKLNSIDGIDKAIADACAVSFEHKAIIEEYIEGNEYSMETISYNSEHHYLATTKKYTTGSPDFIEMGHIQPSDLPQDILDGAIDTVKKALTALHIENSAGHSEFKIDKYGKTRIIEIGARMGGDCIGSDLVCLSTGNDFMKMVIDVACGNEPEICEKPLNNKTEIRFIFNENDIQNFEQFKQRYPEKLYRVSDFELENLGNATDSSTRVGYYIIKW